MVQAESDYSRKIFEQDLYHEEKTEAEHAPEIAAAPRRKLSKDFCDFFTRMTSYSNNDELESIKRACLLRKAAMLEKAIQIATEPALDGLRPTIGINLEALKESATPENPVSPSPVSAEGKQADMLSRIPEPLLDSTIFQEIVKAGEAINEKTKDEDEEFHDSYHYFSR